MPRLGQPRRTCPTCRKSVKVRHDGTLRRHWDTWVPARSGGRRYTSGDPICLGEDPPGGRVDEHY